MTSYKGIRLSENKHIESYISTYHILDRDNYENYLDNDIPLQKMVQKHYLKKKVFVTAYTFSIWGIIAVSLMLIVG